ncbi:MAG: hypothetical protein H7A38_02905 [Chlamydiales bacterium]|nr:hypothetical protein [Chlamydiales bacterium]
METLKIRNDGFSAASTQPPTGQGAEIAQQRFSVITPEEASQLPEARKFLEVGIFDRIKGLFSSNQAKINAAKNLLAKPTHEVSRSVRVIADLNNLIKDLNKDIRETRHAFDIFEDAPEKKFQLQLVNETNYEQFLVALESGSLATELGKAGLDATRISLFNLSIQLLVGNYSMKCDKHGERVAGNLRELLTPAMNDLVQWDNALMSMQAMTTDTLFRAVVAAATANVQAHDRVANHTAGQTFVQENTAELWAKSGQGQFLKEVADEFAAAIEGIDSEDNSGIKVDALFTKIDSRARKIAAVLNIPNHTEIRNDLLNQLNRVEGFEANLKKAQGELLELVADRQDLAKVSAPQIALITSQQQEIQNAGKKISGSTLKGEDAIRAAFEATLSPGVGNDLTAAVGKQDQGPNLTLTADDAVKVFGETNQAIATLLEGNKTAVAEAQGEAGFALNKLRLMNQLVGPAKQDELAVDTKKVNQPITYQKGAAPFHVAHELTGELLEMIDTLANGNETHAPSPTQLEAVLRALQSQKLTVTDESGTHTVSALSVVLRKEVDLQTIFANQSVDFAGQEFKIQHQGVQLLTFLQHDDSTPDAPKGIDALRAQIKAVKEAREAEEAERKASLVGTITAEVAAEVLTVDPASPRELETDRVSEGTPEAQPGLARRIFSAIGRGIQSIVGGAANARTSVWRTQPEPGLVPAVPTHADRLKVDQDRLVDKFDAEWAESPPTTPREPVVIPSLDLSRLGSTTTTPATTPRGETKVTTINGANTLVIDGGEDDDEDKFFEPKKS